MGKIMKKAAMKKRVSALDALPSEVVAEIAARVVSSSPAISCKLLHEAARDKWVFKRAVLMDESRNLDWWLYHGDSWPLVLTCAEAGNPMALCALSMLRCYSIRKNEKDKFYLAAAAKEGCVEAIYPFGILLLAEHEPSKAADAEWLERAAKAAGGGAAGLINSRKMVMQLLRHMWIADGLRHPQPWHCMDDKCGMLVRSEPSKGWWCEEDQEADRRFCSSLCRSIHEFNKFVEKV